jgi:hypothetical protein
MPAVVPSFWAADAAVRRAPPVAPALLASSNFRGQSPVTACRTLFALHPEIGKGAPGRSAAPRIHELIRPSVRIANM